MPSDWEQLCEVRSPLWNDAGEVDAELERGKVQNLRVAVRRLDGIYVEADAVFSFWGQIGRATRWRGFVAGRLLREGCLIPAIGGGLCQLSNALYELALRAEFDVLERHGHSRVIVGSAATLGRDATVAWNYVDLRFRSSESFFLRARLTRSELVIELWGEPSKVLTQHISGQETSFAPIILFETRPALQATAHSCATCGDTNCFRHDARPRQCEGQSAWILDEVWPEWVELIKGQARKEDVLLAPRPELWPREGWQKVEGARLCAWQRSLETWRAAKLGSGGAVWRAQLESSERIARALEGRLSSEVTHLVIAQSLLPFLWQSGALGGRTFDVLLTRAPLDDLSARLDEAFRKVGDPMLSDFRAPSNLMRAEREALEVARMVYSPHEHLMKAFGGRSRQLDWIMPGAISWGAKEGESRDAIVLAGSALARKGAYAVRDAARTLGLPVVIAGRDWMGKEFWNGVIVRELGAGELWENIARVAVLPAAIEHAPRLLLRALSLGIPVIASPECGLGEREGVTTVPFGDSEALIEALRIFS